MSYPSSQGPQGGPQFSPQGGMYPPRKRSKAPWIVGGLAAVVLCCGGGVVAMVAGGGDSGSTTASGAPAEPEAEKPAVRLGQPARDGKFEFTVRSVRCGKTRVGNSVIGEDAQGVFCEVKLTVRNIGDQAQMFDGSAQKAFDAKGVEYSNDGAAEIMAGGSKTFLEEINPGNAVVGMLLYDVPKGTKLTSIELHDSAFSGGVTVALS